MDTKDLVKKYWNDRPCNIKHSKKEFGSKEYFDEFSVKFICLKDNYKFTCIISYDLQ